VAAYTDGGPNGKIAAVFWWSVHRSEVVGCEGGGQVEFLELKGPDRPRVWSGKIDGLHIPSQTKNSL
jgi:hypothetical protein